MIYVFRSGSGFKMKGLEKGGREMEKKKRRNLKFASGHGLDRADFTYGEKQAKELGRKIATE